MSKGKAMVPNVRDYFHVRLSFRSFLGNLETTIEQRLKEPFLSDFKSSCFGHLLLVPPIQFQGQLIAHILFRQDESHPTSELVFHLEGKEVSMNHVLFALITGLRFGSFPAAPTKSALYKKVFGRYKTGIVFENIADELERYSEVEGEGQTTLKLAMLYTLVGVLLCPSHSRKIDEKWIHLVDDLEKFNKYPWGRVVFDTLAFEVHEFMRMGIKKCIDEKRELEKFDILWVCASSSGVGIRNFAMCWRILWPESAGGLKLAPRLLRWKDEATPRFKELTTKCFPLLRLGDEENGLMVLKPNYSETRSDYYMSVHRWIEELENVKNSGYGEEELENTKNSGHGEDRRKKKMKGVVVEEWDGKETVERLVEQVTQ